MMISCIKSRLCVNLWFPREVETPSFMQEKLDDIIFEHRNPRTCKRVGRDASHGQRRRRRHYSRDANARYQASLTLGRNPRRHACPRHAHALARHAIPRDAVPRHAFTRHADATHARLHPWWSKYNIGAQLPLISRFGVFNPLTGQSHSSLRYRPGYK